MQTMPRIGEPHAPSREQQVQVLLSFIGIADYKYYSVECVQSTLFSSLQCDCYETRHLKKHTGIIGKEIESW